MRSVGSFISRPSRLRRTSAVALALLLAGGVLTACSDDDGGGGDDGSGDGDGDTGATEEVTLKFSSTLTQGSALANTLEWWLKEVEDRSEGQIKFDTYWAASLLAGPDVIAGLADQRADVAFFVPAFVPADVPLSMLAWVPGVAENPVSTAMALQDLYTENEYLVDEYEKLGVKMMTAQIVGHPGSIVTKDKLSGTADLDGKRIRALGAPAIAMQKLGIDPVAVGVEEVYESIERGVLDGASGVPLDTMPAQKMHEVAPWVTELNIGYWGSSSIVFSEATWETLSADQQEIIAGVNADFIEASIPIQEAGDVAGCDAFIEAGGGVVPLPEEDVAEWLDLIGDELIEDWRAASKDAGISDEAIASVESDFAAANEEYESSVSYEDALSACAERTGG